MEGHFFLYLILALVSLLVVLNKKRRRSAKALERGLRLPPGPWQLPVIGTLHHFVVLGELPHRAMRELARRYGPVMLLRNGELPTVVLSSREAAREVMKTHDAAFASRPLTTTVRALTSGGRDIIFAPYGEHWREIRKICVTELLSPRRVLSFRPIREQEVGAMLRACAAAAAGSRTIEMRGRLVTLVTEITTRAVLSDRFENRQVFLRELDRAFELSFGFHPADLWPSSWLVGRLSSSVRRAKECRDKAFETLDGVINEHLERMGSGTGAGEAEDLLDVLLRIQKDATLQIPLDMENIKLIIFEIFGAGSESTATTMEWAMAELIRHPRAMERVTSEVRHAFAAHGKVLEQMLGELRYLQLVIRETLRLHAPVPLLLPRECGEPCRVLGYDVPKGTTVLVNAWALGRDERYWPGDPEEFRPERFEADHVQVDFKGADFELVPFGAGRRICPGIGFGVANVELALASLLFHFDWEAPAGGLDMTEAFGISGRRKCDLALRPIQRVPVPPPCA